MFGGYASAELPRPHNDLEPLVGSHRDPERRASGRKVASPGLVVLGAVRVVCGLATRLRPEGGLRRGAGSVAAWRQRREEREKRRRGRRQQRRCRRDPVSDLKKLEEMALQLSLLP